MAQSFTGSVTGFNHNNAIDLANLNDATTTLSYAGNATSGILTVSDGTTTAHIGFTGNYTGATFAHSNDGSGHALITETGVLAPQQSAAVALFAQSSAAFAPRAGYASAHPIAEQAAGLHPLLAASSRLAA